MKLYATRKKDYLPRNDQEVLVGHLVWADSLEEAQAIAYQLNRGKVVGEVPVQDSELKEEG